MPQAQVWTDTRLQPQALAMLKDIATVSVASKETSTDWCQDASQAEAIIIGGNTNVTGDIMDRLSPHLRAIARYGIGVDRIDLQAATQRGIMVLNTPEGPTESTAEHAIALLLNLCKRVMAADRSLRAGNGFQANMQQLLGLETAGATLGLVGLGRIGSRVATIARVLGMHVLAFDPFIPKERASEMGVELVPTLADVLSRSQVVSLHSPATQETRHLINAETLKLMPQGSYLINVARGSLVDEQALLDALRSGHLAGAALDVYEPEPPAADNPLFSHPNTICTPHIASFTAAGVLRMQVMACEQVASALRGERPKNLVNADVWGHQRTD
ncbi:hydroxyacid dehydrogenase [Ktedonosporobacter rubrisoli]|uniref:Hydroxyacid dehydrogenase n=1 Tax=Ktedonosporobacter rubrisoli TaxID=2509675 RepID=A0A4P6JRA3_KTERU|nr:hydroxyacid dehydrogenase [Ktedonosporobacter rubrisoli]QBD77979.1 hydroxyacid dehydrogenase [Ktedonosporobacter rubrisoli]